MIEQRRPEREWTEPNWSKPAEFRYHSKPFAWYIDSSSIRFWAKADRPKCSLLCFQAISVNLKLICGARCIFVEAIYLSLSCLLCVSVCVDISSSVWPEKNTRVLAGKNKRIGVQVRRETCKCIKSVQNTAWLSNLDTSNSNNNNSRSSSRIK